MGGFHYFDADGKPIRPLGEDDVEALAKDGELIPPSEAEIKGLSKGDGLSKLIVLGQTLWFIVQCLA